MKINDIRGHFDERYEKIGKKIRDAETKKVPFMLIIGEQEMLEESVSIRKHGGEDLGKMKITDFINYFKQELTINQKNNWQHHYHQTNQLHQELVVLHPLVRPITEDVEIWSLSITLTTESEQLKLG